MILNYCSAARGNWHVLRLTFFSQELFPTRALEVSNQGETNLVIWVKILPRPIIQKSMAGASKALWFPKPEAYKKLLEAHSNACSLVPKLGEVKILINSFPVDMLCITETWLNSNVMDAEVSIENYNIFRGDRQSGKRGRGVTLYVKCEHLQRCFSLDFNSDSSFAELVAC